MRNWHLCFRCCVNECIRIRCHPSNRDGGLLYITAVICITRRPSYLMTPVQLQSRVFFLPGHRRTGSCMFSGGSERNSLIIGQDRVSFCVSKRHLRSHLSSFRTGPRDSVPVRHLLWSCLVHIAFSRSALVLFPSSSSPRRATRSILQIPTHTSAQNVCL